MKFITKGIITTVLSLYSLYSYAIDDNSESKIFSVPAHSRSAKLNAEHASKCAEIGGVDVTDGMNFSVGRRVDDFYVCKIVNHAKYKQTVKVSTSGQITHNDKRPLDATYEYFKINSVTAPNGYFSSRDINVYSTASYSLKSNQTEYGHLKTSVYEACSVAGDVEFPPGSDGGDYYVNLACTVHCPPGDKSSDATACYSKSCQSPSQNSNDKVRITDVNPEKNMGAPSQPPACNLPNEFFGNPINILSGNKYQKEVDIKGYGTYPLSFYREYNSIDGLWRFNYSANIQKTGTIYKLKMNDGRLTTFTSGDGQSFAPSPTEFGTLTRLDDGYRYTSPFNEVYDFDSSGRLIRIATTNGLEHKIKYLSLTELVVSDSYGHSLDIHETQSNQPLSVKSSDGITASYQYDNQYRLIKATVDGVSRTYHYEDSNYPRALTGITNEKGIRYVTWTYNAAGQATSSVHPNGKDKVTIRYDSSTSTVLTNPLGRSYTYEYTTIDGIARISKITGHGTSLCPQINSNYYYNTTNGLLNSKINDSYSGRSIKTDYQYNAKGQEITRTIASGTGNAITVKTTWDDKFPNKPATETYPDKVITYSYDTKGNLISRNIKTLN